MIKIFLVRHGKASSNWDEALDPGLDEQGKKQSMDVADSFAAKVPIRIVSSPLRRARETSLPLSDLWNVKSVIDERISEIPTPHEFTNNRSQWLREVMQGNWPDQCKKLQDWRDRVVDAIQSYDQDTVVFSHFIAINAIVGEALKKKNVIQFLPDNGSITTITVHHRKISLVEKGEESVTLIG
ncbi:histidine phosphatase family protein [bacterium]|nr:histidine phosphatase family protein [bacterium]